MGKALKNGKIASPAGLLFQIPVFFIAIFGLYSLIEKFYYSLTDFNGLEKPVFIGLKNYFDLFKEVVVLKSFTNTVIMVLSVAALLFITAVLPAIFIARLKLPFGIIIMVSYSFVSVCAMLPNVFRIFFSGDSYGTLNALLLNARLINEPVVFIQLIPMLLSIVVFWLYCLAPVFIITYIAARMKHSFLGVSVSCCLIPVLMYGGGGCATAIVGSPSKDYVADWFYNVFNDYLLTRYNIGFAYAIMFAGLLMLIVWCAAVSVVTLGFWAVCKNINSGSKGFKVMGYISFVFALFAFTWFNLIVASYLLKSLMPLDELFIFPPSIFPKRPTIQNFYRLFTLSANSFTPIYRYIINSLLVVPLVIMPVCAFIALPSGVGFGLFKSFKQQKLLFISFVPFLFISGCVTVRKIGLLNTYSVYMLKFISSFWFIAAVFLVYLAARLVFSSQKPRVLSIIVGCLFVVSSFNAIGVIYGIWCNNTSVIFEESLKTWKNLSLNLVAGGVVRVGEAAANDLLMLIATFAVLIIPLILFLALYIMHRKIPLESNSK